jgi:serine protease Do
MNLRFLLCSILVFALAVTGCNRTPPAAQTDVTESPADAAKKNAAAPAVQDSFTPQTKRLISSADVPLLEQINHENEKVVAAATPCIVRITALMQEDPHAELFGNFPFKFPGLPKGVKTTVPSYGSGVIISHDGYIVTNNHVVEDAESVTVQLRDQRSFPAKVVARDAPSDIAVLKIAQDGLPAMPWGDSDKVEVGEQVFAIGNPFDLDDSVSKGIVSAKGRNLPDTTNYED